MSHTGKSGCQGPGVESWLGGAALVIAAARPREGRGLRGTGRGACSGPRVGGAGGQGKRQHHVTWSQSFQQISLVFCCRLAHGTEERGLGLVIYIPSIPCWNGPISTYVLLSFLSSDYVFTRGGQQNTGLQRGPRPHPCSQRRGSFMRQSGTEVVELKTQVRWGHPSGSSAGPSAIGGPPKWERDVEEREPGDALEKDLAGSCRLRGPAFAWSLQSQPTPAHGQTSGLCGLVGPEPTEPCDNKLGLFQAMMSLWFVTVVGGNTAMSLLACGPHRSWELVTPQSHVRGCACFLRTQAPHFHQNLRVGTVTARGWGVRGPSPHPRLPVSLCLHLSVPLPASQVLLPLCSAADPPSPQERCLLCPGLGPSPPGLTGLKSPSPSGCVVGVLRHSRVSSPAPAHLWPPPSWPPFVVPDCAKRFPGLPVTLWSARQSPDLQIPFPCGWTAGPCLSPLGAHSALHSAMPRLPGLCLLAPDTDAPGGVQWRGTPGPEQPHRGRCGHSPEGPGLGSLGPCWPVRDPSLSGGRAWS